MYIEDKLLKIGVIYIYIYIHKHVCARTHTRARARDDLIHTKVDQNLSTSFRVEVGREKDGRTLPVRCY